MFELRNAIPSGFVLTTLETLASPDLDRTPSKVTNSAVYCIYLLINWEYLESFLYIFIYFYLLHAISYRYTLSEKKIVLFQTGKKLFLIKKLASFFLFLHSFNDILTNIFWNDRRNAGQEIVVRNIQI